MAQEEVHADPTTEAGGRVLEAAAVFASLAEALARARAEQLRRRAGADREETRRIGSEQPQRRNAGRDEYEADRAIFSQANDPEWLQHADILDLAEAWKAAGTHAPDDPRAAAAMETVEGQLREMYPAPMKLYDSLRAQGQEPQDAMRPAAEMMTKVPPYTAARTHGTGERVRLQQGVSAAAETPKNAARLAGEGFAAPLKPALARVSIHPPADAPNRPKRRTPLVSTGKSRT